MNFASIFTGIGGFDLGFEQAGLECFFQCEIDKDCKQLLDRHWSDVIFHSDINQFRWAVSGADIICGGFPCQDLSVASHGPGLAGEKSGLFFPFIALVEKSAPKWVVIENVPGLLHSNGGRDMGIVLSSLAELGYGWAYRVLDAQYFGLAQGRKRVFIVGGPDVRSAAGVLFDAEDSCWDTTQIRRKKFAKERTPFDLADEVLTDHSRGICASPRLARTVTASGSRYSTEEPYVVQHGRPRRLTPLEYERLQGFPDNWTDGFSNTVRYRMLGNAVPPPITKWIGQRLT